YQALFNDELWRKVALHSNIMAQKLGDGLAKIKGITITRPIVANAVFACIPTSWNEPLMRNSPFYVWREDINEVRLMCAWDTNENEIQDFLKACVQIVDNN
ncbi:MAG: threonine aldolase, partial [Chitinophagaceae bacterium]|nr:threonine aldolase [Chitinophagaceae bacterium]